MSRTTRKNFSPYPRVFHVNPRSFYEEELQKIIVSKNKSFKVEKILGQKKQGKSTLVLVKWLGWPSNFNSYIDKKNSAGLAISLKRTVVNG